MATRVLIDTTTFLLFIVSIFGVVMWKLNARTVKNEEGQVGIKESINDIKTNHLAHIHKQLRFLTGVVISHFPPHTEELKRQFDELEAID